MKAKILLSIMLISLVACAAGPNPNPGERTADMLWSKYKHSDALEIITPKAKAGIPWAQVRLGVAYELGNGVSKNTVKALYWYKQAAVQQGNDQWSEGLLIGATGTAGYFNQNSDSMVAQYQIANIYLRGDGVKKNLITAYLWAKHLINASAGKNVFYCCEFEGGRWITQKSILSTLEQIESELSLSETKEAKSLSLNWKPSTK